MENEKLKNRLTPCVPLRFPGFEKQYQYEQEKGVGETLAYNFEPVDCRDWYRDFAGKTIKAVDVGRYLPIYRMGDGEYLFALRKNPEGDKSFMKLSFRNKIKRIIRKIRGVAQKGGWSGEAYTIEERNHAHKRFVEGVKMVSRKGILSLALHETPLYEEYIDDMLDWLDRTYAVINKNNYIHTYAIYALLNGPDRERLLNGRKVLVVSHFDEDRKKSIRGRLKSIGVEDIEFLEVSKHKSMLDNIDVGKVDTDLDLILIAAGIGSINVINQLKCIDVPQIDIGYCLDVIENPNLSWKRPFCTPDDKFDPKKVEFV